ncbi:hypothetical protein F2P81_019423 [Scophthalmus maximus]|uniref:Uncharacterized protein n=1 Tax=Scophthalmus maximus TaxID=52904 RepID=A0A6A4RZK4_SCOMX|nr:hypothetical protein F2P81_019423 [Scophthalmus maximus]
MRAGDELRPAAVRTETPLPRPAPWRIPQQQRQRRYYAETELRSQAGHRNRKRYRCGRFKEQIFFLNIVSYQPIDSDAARSTTE